MSTGNAVNFKFHEVVKRFRAWGDFVEAVPYGSGHINDTFKVTFGMAGAPVHYLLQRINHNIFKNPRAVMDNIVRVTNHVRSRLTEAGVADVTRHSLCVVFTRDAQPCHQDADGNWWRMYLFVEGARTYDTIQNERQAFEAARAYARFQNMLADLPLPRLNETIPNFHNTPVRLEALKKAIANDACNRAVEAHNEIAFVEKRAALCGRLLDRHAKGEIPERITHNDTKLNNVMLDDTTGEGVCVIDLDTVMPGLALYDFGDMVRSATAAASEDERDLSKVRMRLEMFKSIAGGYLSEAGFLNPAEREELVFSARLITQMIGMRFLTDYLQGDIYFKTKRPGQNLDRCRAQFKMVESMEAQQDEMERVVAAAWSDPK
ncbi:MAG: aminoglycoside phosphotransferase family protein [bacterium]